MFDIKIRERTFYLVAETREDMNNTTPLLSSVLHLSHFPELSAPLPCHLSATPGEDLSFVPLLIHLWLFWHLLSGSLGNISTASYGPCSPAEISRSHQHLPEEREPTSKPPMSHHVPSTWPSASPQGCLCLHQQASQRAGHAR
ncbi:GRB2-associated-binding protein 4-like [Callithrix jacchus]